MPVASQVGCVARHGDVVSHADRNRSVAPRADVLLHRLIRLNASHLDGPVEAVPDAEATSLGGHAISP